MLQPVLIFFASRSKTFFLDALHSDPFALDEHFHLPYVLCKCKCKQTAGGMLTENCVVLAEGAMDGGVFRVKVYKSGRLASLHHSFPIALSTQLSPLVIVIASTSHGPPAIFNFMILVSIQTMGFPPPETRDDSLRVFNGLDLIGVRIASALVATFFIFVRNAPVASAILNYR